MLKKELMHVARAEAKWTLRLDEPVSKQRKWADTGLSVLLSVIHCALPLSGITCCYPLPHTVLAFCTCWLLQLACANQINLLYVCLFPCFIPISVVFPILKYLLCWQHCLHTHIYQNLLFLIFARYFFFFPRKHLLQKQQNRIMIIKILYYFSIELSFKLS